jgi:hypothetical protein
LSLVGTSTHSEGSGALNTLGRVLLVLALLAIVAVGIWLVGSLRAPASIPTPAEQGLLEQLIPQPTPTIYPSSSTVIRSVQRLARLETISYRIEKVITAETGQGPLGFLFGDRVLLVAAGEVIGGIDLAKLSPADVAVTSSGTLFVRLPKAEVFVATLDNEKTYVYDRETGVIGLNPQLETAARREAERMILEGALEDGLEAQAQANGEAFLSTFLLALGFEEVVFTEVVPTPTSEPTPTAAAAAP